jgi:pyridoxine 5'-phosphate synthase PdxJ
VVQSIEGYVVPLFVWESQEALHKSKTKRPRIELMTQHYATSPHLPKTQTHDQSLYATDQKIEPTTHRYATFPH